MGVTETAQKMDELSKKVMKVEKKLLFIVGTYIKVLLIYGFISGVYLSIYYSHGAEVVLVLLGSGVVYFGLKQKSESAVLARELRNYLKKKEAKDNA